MLVFCVTGYLNSCIVLPLLFPVCVVCVVRFVCVVAAVMSGFLFMMQVFPYHIVAHCIDFVSLFPCVLGVCCVAHVWLHAWCCVYVEFIADGGVVCVLLHDYVMHG
jgi:hypothetical protein